MGSLCPVEPSQGGCAPLPRPHYVAAVGAGDQGRLRGSFTGPSSKHCFSRAPSCKWLQVTTVAAHRWEPDLREAGKGLGHSFSEQLSVWF